MARLAGRRALVTGAASGIGREVARRFLAEQAAVAVIDISSDGLAEAWSSAEPAPTVITGDVADETSVAAMVAATITALRGIDIVVNCAGIYAPVTVFQAGAADLERLLRVNVVGTFLVAQAAARQMRDQGTPGVIINLSSVAAELCTDQNFLYAATKGAVRSLTKGLAVALAPYHIRVNAIGPGPIATPAGLAAMEDPDYAHRMLHRILRGRAGTVEDVAAAAVFLCSDEADFITGTTLYVDGGVLAVR